MPSIELTVKNLDEAAATAAEQLGVSADQVKITVIEESKKLFGKVSYKVKAEAPDAPAAAAPAAPAEEKKKAPAKAKKAEVAPAEEAPAAPAAEEKKAAAPKKLGAKKKVDDAPAAAPVVAPVASETPAEESAPAAEQEEDAGPEIAATPEDAAKLGDILELLAKQSGLEAEIVVGELQGKYINLSIDGKEAGYLVGKNGEVLNSLQYLINLIAKQQLGNGVRVTLDGNDYRKKRAESLTALAEKIADKVKERGEEAVLEALPAFERRVIHKALQEIEGVVTYSEGEEPDRRVVIAPVD
ncbi:MAG: RNA-binding cell elongation regulator Jag/EloR [Fimbriimonas sp.]|nr:RNA-binding cell elongation regulator Jag/EloR [Fimbriimonas sp.]